MAIGPILRNARLAKQLTESQVAELTRMKIQIVQDLEKDDFHRIAATIYGKGFIKLYAECVGLDPQPLINDYLRTVEGDSPSLIASQDERNAARPAKRAVKPAKRAKKKKLSHSSVPPPSPGIAVDNLPVQEGNEHKAEDDLFSYSRRKNRIIDEDVRTADDMPQNPRRAAGESALEKIRKSLATLSATAVKHWTAMLERLGKVQWGDRPVKIIGSVVAGLIVLLIIVSIVRGCSQSPSATPTAVQELRTNVVLPEPYFD